MMFTLIDGVEKLTLKCQGLITDIYIYFFFSSSNKHKYR